MPDSQPKNRSLIKAPSTEVARSRSAMAERGLDLAKQLDGRSAAKPPEVAPNDADAYIKRGRAYHQLSQYDKAIADYTEAIRLNPDDADAYYNRGYAYNELGEEDKAAADLAKAKELGED